MDRIFHFLYYGFQIERSVVIMWIWIILGFIAIVLVFTNIRVVPRTKAYVIER